MSTSDVQKIEWAHGNFLRYSKLKLGWWSFLDCFRVRRLIETCFACHIQHLKCLKMFFFVPCQFCRQCRPILERSKKWLTSDNFWTVFVTPDLTGIY